MFLNLIHILLSPHISAPAWEILRPEGTRPQPKRVSERSARGLALIINARSPESLSPSCLYPSLGGGGEEGGGGTSWSVTNKGLLTGFILWKTREAGKGSSTNYLCQTSTKPLLDSSLIFPFLGGWGGGHPGALLTRAYSQASSCEKQLSNLPQVRTFCANFCVLFAKQWQINTKQFNDDDDDDE